MAQQPKKIHSLPEDQETTSSRNSSKASTPTLTYVDKDDKKRSSTNNAKRPTSTKANRNSGTNESLQLESNSSSKEKIIDNSNNNSSSMSSNNKIDELKIQLNDAKRDNQALQAKLRAYEEEKKKKSKNLDKEKEMRVAANQEKHWLQSQLTKFQMALEARLKLLGIDFSQCSNLSEALEAAFRAIQALSKELADKELEIEKWKAENNKLQQSQGDLQDRVNNMETELKKQRKIIDDQRKNAYNKERQISTLGHQTDDLAAERAKYEAQMSKLRDSINQQKKKHLNNLKILQM